MKQALEGLGGIEHVRDEWDKDLLHVTYDAEQVTVKEMQETIQKEGFKATILP